LDTNRHEHKQIHTHTHTHSDDTNMYSALKFATQTKFEIRALLGFKISVETHSTQHIQLAVSHCCSCCYCCCHWCRFIALHKFY